MTIQEGNNGDKNVYVDHAIVTIRMVEGSPVAEPDVVYLNNGGTVEWAIDTGADFACEIRFKTDHDETCPFVFPNQDTGCKPSEEGCFTFSKPGQFISKAQRVNPQLDEEIWTYDIVVGPAVSDPVIRLKNTPDGG